MLKVIFKIWILLSAALLMLSACTSEDAGVGGGASEESLASLSVSTGTLTPAFDVSVTEYAVTVPYAVNSIDISTTLSEDSLVEVNGTNYQSSINVHTIALNVGSQTVSLVVTYGLATAPQTRTYHVSVTRLPAATNVNLSALTVNSGSLSPAFSANTTSYAVTVPYTTSSIGITPTAADAGASLTVDGTTVTSGSPSGAIALNVGANVFSIVSSNGASGIDLLTKTYTVTVTRTAPSPVASLAGLNLSSGTLSPVFASNTTTYSATVGYLVDSVTVTATTTNAQAELQVEGAIETSGQASSSLPLSVGANALTVLVTAEDGTTTNTYTVNVTRTAPSSNANLASLTLSSGMLSPAFSSNTISYTASVDYAIDSIQFSPTIAVSGATVAIDGNVEISGQPSSLYPLAEGANVFSIVVLAEDESTTKTYTVTVTRAGPSTDNTLSGLSVNPGVLNPAFDASTLSYTVLISDNATDFTVTAAANDPDATIEGSWNSGNFDPMTSNVASPLYVPNPGANDFVVRVTSQSGAVKTYTLNVIYNICGAGYYDSGDQACSPVSLGYYSPAADDNRYSCSNKPSNAHYTSPTADSLNCPWSCDTGYLTTNGISCTSYPNATILACDDDEVAVGLYGRSGSIIDRIGVRCATITDGVVSSVVRNGPTYGGTGGTDFSADCLPNSTAIEVDGDLASYLAVTRTGRVRFRCVDTDLALVSLWSPLTYWGGSFGMGAFNFACGTGANPHGNHMNGIIIDNAGGAAYVGPVLGITCR